MYAFSSGREIGIDVEAVRVIGDAEHIAACFFSRRENEAYLVLERRDKPLGFFNCWTRKKASSGRSATGFTIPSHCSRRALEASAASGRLPDFKGPLCPPATASVSPVHPVASRTRLRLRQSPLAKRFINTLPIWVNIGPESELVPGHRSEGWATCLRRFWRGNRSLAPISVIAAGADSIRTTEKNKGHGLATVPCGPTSKQMDDYTLFGRLGS